MFIRAKSEGIEVLAITDHDTIDEPDEDKAFLKSTEYFLYMEQSFLLLTILVIDVSIFFAIIRKTLGLFDQSAVKRHKIGKRRE